MADVGRRGFLAGGAAALAFVVEGSVTLLTPAEARARNLPLEHFSTQQGAMLERLAEALVPGAREAGVLHFIDQQLGARDGSLLMIKYLGVPPAGRAGFYRAAVDAALAAAGGSEPAGDADLVQRMGTDAISGWTGPPASFAYFVLRADALDVVYGTRDGFSQLGIPYMAHIDPPADW